MRKIVSMNHFTIIIDISEADFVFSIARAALYAINQLMISKQSMRLHHLHLMDLGGAHFEFLSQSTSFRERLQFQMKGSSHQFSHT